MPTKPTVRHPLKQPYFFAGLLSGRPHFGHVAAFVLTGVPQSRHVVNRAIVASEENPVSITPHPPSFRDSLEVCKN